MSANCWRMMTLLASSSEFECPTVTVACAMKPEHLGGCSQSVQSGVAPDCSGRWSKSWSKLRSFADIVSRLKTAKKIVEKATKDKLCYFVTSHCTIRFLLFNS